MKLRKEKRICLYGIAKGKGNQFDGIKNGKGNQFDEIEPVRMELKRERELV